MSAYLPVDIATTLNGSEPGWNVLNATETIASEPRVAALNLQGVSVDQL